MSEDYWASAAGTREAEKVFDVLEHGGDLRRVAPRRVGGRVDLRGLESQAHRSDSVLVSAANLALKDIDFTGSSIPGLQLERATVSNCVFDYANIDGMECRGTDFEQCSFTKASLRNAQLSTPSDKKYSVFTRVSFSRTDLRGAGCQDASFDHVTFDKASLGAISFRGSNFIECTFSGTLQKVVFWNISMTGRKVPSNSMDGVDFTAATLRDVEFRGIDLSRVTLPEGDPHVTVGNYGCTMEKAINMLPVKDQPFTYGLRAYLAAELRLSHPQREKGIWHRSSLGKTPEEQQFAISTLRQAERACNCAESS
ncbi:pentapeptide repeat-containing protein [Streptomyces sp. SID9727]|uniref:pentapeptide repeat-containing protein n=1 Tax=Streptomyces sp. SID9727 TaxID=2706114 RepID=UPI0013C94093|nr:pentapeptide repeat-containing protein [Streptomyces sp. SID9727]NEC66604.1 pentapeptide repeat-containing protein [Streptomyces sp. SID9727]